MTEIQRLLNRIVRLEALQAIGRSLSSSPDLRTALAAALADAARWLGADSGSVCLINPTTGFLEIEATVGFPVGADQTRLRLGEGMTGWVARSGFSARTGNVAKEPRYVALRDGVCSEVAVPLGAGEEIVGVLNLDADRMNGFDDAAEEFLREVAALMTPVIRQAWLYESARHRARLLESLVRIGQLINSTLSRDEALTTVTREARSLIGAKMCSLLLLDEGREWLELQAHHGAGEAYVANPRLAVGESLLGIVVRRRKPMQVENIQESGRYQNVRIAREEGLVSLLSVPLLYRDRAIGTLNVYTGSPHVFSDQEVRALLAYAELSALALERARLYERIVVVEEELRQSERLSALGLLAAEIAHEIRNPLTVMKMLHHALSPDTGRADEWENDFRIMGEKMDQLNQIVDRVLDFARRTEPKLAATDVNQLLDDLHILTRHKLKAQGVALEHRLDSRLPRVLADATQLEQAFLNLTLNAVEAMPEGGILRIRSRALPIGTRGGVTTHVAVRFRDTGVGMSSEQQALAFKTVLNTTKARGSGLGLAIVGRVIEQHHGVIRVHSHPGRGTVFTLVLPVRH
ncbi:MAG: GAF domain-containing protein [Pedosphaera sp.]|nr:GAF domain-containing protein [Pedosphaera sp.]